MILNAPGWIFLLPYVDQAPAYNQYNFNVCSSMSSPYSLPVAGTDATNVAITGMNLPMINCPSDPTAGTVSSESAGTTAFYSRNNGRYSSYLFSTGTFDDYSTPYGMNLSDIRQGTPFGNSGAARLRDMADDASNCWLIGESWAGA